MDRSLRYPQSFFERPAYIVAPELLGAYLHHIVDGQELIGRIVETEAYDQADEACHAYTRKTPRNAPLFKAGGISYVYFTYGMHYCFNVVTDLEAHGSAVLIRAVEPIKGIDIMRDRRQKARNDRELTSGPARLTQAMNIAIAENEIDLIESDKLFLTKGTLNPPESIAVTTRIGITKAIDLPWRFFIQGNLFVSRGKPS